MIPWHRLFGIALTDFFTDTPVEVILEMDLSLKQQFLDVVVVRRGKGRIRRKLPDGFEPLATHNLMTFKSAREALDAWAIKELVGHSVNYRKQVTDSKGELLPEDQFQLFAIATRFPENLAAQVELVPMKRGTYYLRWGLDTIRVIVLSEIPLADHNLILNLFSSKIEGPKFVWDHIKGSRPTLSGLINQIFESHLQSRYDMPYTIQDFQRDYVKEHLDCLADEERMKGIPDEERMKGIPAEVRIKGLTAEELEAYARQLRQSKAETRLRRKTASAKPKPGK